MSTSGLMTEREWRKQMERASKSRPTYCGAQCIVKNQKSNVLMQDRAFHAFLIFLSIVIAVFMPVFIPKAEKIEYVQIITNEQISEASVREVSDISYGFPSDMALQSVTYTSEQLLRGKLLLIDEEHPIPEGIPAPNTFSIAAYGKGMIPVSDLNIKSGRETIEALRGLFSGLNARGISGFAVSGGTLSAMQQREIQLDQLTRYAALMSLNDAVVRTRTQTDAPGHGELEQEYTVEIRPNLASMALADDRPLGETEHGRYLLKDIWRYGFVQRSPNGEGAKKYCFRFVGKAHATAMTYLDIPFESYLLHLHQKGEITVRSDGEIKYIILCKPMEGTHVEFLLPISATYEISLDNMGYAVVACTMNE
ncbi:MAG: M15 family metallopeptidase [Clostridiales bacterium]|nr:M15 family metallopeptidase [Clostridiales bacterium]